MSVWYHEGKDAIWCNLVVQPFLVLVCTYAMRNDSEMPAKGCELECELLCFGACACMQHPCSFVPLPNTTHPDSVPVVKMDVTVQKQVSHQQLAPCESEECVQSCMAVKLPVPHGVPIAISPLPLIRLS
jgi:hypothetical protein